MTTDSSVPSSWPPEFSDLKRLETILQCGICYAFMKNPVITSCSHTYCSHCIRRYMQFKNHCPICSEETHENQLRGNRLVDEVITLFSKVRIKLITALQLMTVAAVTVPIESQISSPASITPSKKSSKSPLKPHDNHLDKPSPVDSFNPDPGPSKAVDVFAGGSDVMINGVKVPGIFNSAQNKEKKSVETVLCPVCQAELPATKINAHLDELCLRAGPSAKVTKVVKRKPLPKRLYHLLKDKELKKCMKDLGLNVNGDRKILISRIQKYTVIYNAENDAPNPRPVSELIAQLEREEMEEKKPQTLISSMMKRIPIDRKSDPELIEKANKAYREEQKKSFQALIDNMRARDGRNIKPLKPAPRVYSDDENNPYLRTPSGCQANEPSTSKEPDRIEVIDTDSEVDNESETGPTRKNHGAIDWSRTEISESDDDENEILPISMVSTSWESPVKEGVRETASSIGDSSLEKQCTNEPHSLVGSSPVRQPETIVAFRPTWHTPVKLEEPKVTNGSNEDSAKEKDLDDARMGWNSDVGEDDDESSIEMSFRPKERLSKSCNSTPAVHRGSKRRLARQGPGESQTSPVRSFDDASLLFGLRDLKEEVLREKKEDYEENNVDPSTVVATTPPSRTFRRRSKRASTVKQVDGPTKRTSARKKSKLELSPVF